MAPRPTWKGYLRLSLVSCPVRVYSAIARDVSRVVLSNRERLTALMCRDKGLLMLTLRAADQVRDHTRFFVEIKEKAPDPEMLELAERLIEQKSGAFDPSEFRDRYHDAVIEMVKAKVKGQEPVLAKVPEPGKVINPMDALRRSLEEATPAAESKPRQAAAGMRTEPVPGDAKKKRKAGQRWVKLPRNAGA